MPALPRGGWLAALFYFFLRHGLLGLVLLGVLDSSFLALPFANDFAVIVLSSLHHGFAPLYAAAATLGSLGGIAVSYWLGRRGGASFLDTHISPQRIARMREKVNRRGPALLALPGIIPPPFPFTAWVIAAGALDVDRNRFLAACTGVRGLRFAAEAGLALWIGPTVVRWMKMPSFARFVDGLVVVAIAASALSIVQLVRGTRRAQSAESTTKAA